MEIVTKTRVTCPHCGFGQVLDIPADYCQILYQCPRCEARLRPLSGDCCIFCSYGDDDCIPEQRERLEGSSAEGP